MIHEPAATQIISAAIEEWYKYLEDEDSASGALVEPSEGTSLAMDDGNGQSQFQFNPPQCPGGVNFNFADAGAFASPPQPVPIPLSDATGRGRGVHLVKPAWMNS